VYVAPERNLPEVARPTDLYAFTRVPHASGDPQVEICMVTTPDGVVHIDGRSGPLGSDTDRAVLAALRSVASWVLVGAETARAEAYNKPKRDDLRVAVVSRTGNVDLKSPLFSSGAGLLLMPTNAPDVACETIRAGIDSVDFVDGIAQLGGSFIHVEGGPQINAQLLAADLVDAINITFSPTLGGGHGQSIAAPFLGGQQYNAFSLVHLYEDDGFVFARYER
jgi:5-amino-6-(5-phosphoribosylamino)uracil reductase